MDADKAAETGLDLERPVAQEQDSGYPEPLEPRSLVNEGLKPRGEQTNEVPPRDSDGSSEAEAAYSSGAQPSTGSRSRTDHGGAVEQQDRSTGLAADPPGGFTVQIGAFARSDAALGLTFRLKEKGYEAVLVEPEGEQVHYLVWIGQYETAEAASPTQERLRSEGFETYVKRTKKPVSPPR